MALETNKERNRENRETGDDWETILTRRLTDDLDAFLATATDETLFEAEPTIFIPRANRLRFKRLATVAAALTLLGVVAGTTKFYVASPINDAGVELPLKDDDKTSLLAWSVENFSETEWKRHVETSLVDAEFFRRCAAPGAEVATQGEERPTSWNDVEKCETSESELDEWFSVKALSDVAMMEPLKYEPFLQAVAATLR